jgi:DNA processing protein
LYACGTLAGLARPSVALVGTRAASQGGKNLTRRVASELAAAGVTILSGLALGIDAAAHEGALEAGGLTIGVLGGGHRKFFPPRNGELAQRIVAAGGAVCSPFAPDDDAMPYKFLQRNGVVAALSDAVVVIEAPERSGALNTAGWAAGRIPVFVFPGDVDRRNVAGCLALLRDGATLVRGAADILADLGIDRGASVRQQAELLKQSSDRHARVLDALAREPLTPDQLAHITGTSVPQILVLLTELELSSVVSRREGGVFARSPGG